MTDSLGVPGTDEKKDMREWWAYIGSPARGCLTALPLVMAQESAEYWARQTRGEALRIVPADRLEEAERENLKLRHGRYAMARLAADTPQFDNPFVVSEVKALRDRILAEGIPDAE